MESRPKDEIIMALQGLSNATEHTTSANRISYLFIYKLCENYHSIILTFGERKSAALLLVCCGLGIVETDCCQPAQVLHGGRPTYCNYAASFRASNQSAAHDKIRSFQVIFLFLM